MTTNNVQDLRDFIAAHPVGTKLAIATSQYATNTTAPDFRFDFYSTAPAIRSLVKSGMIDAEYGWRYYDVTVLKNASPTSLIDPCNYVAEDNWYRRDCRIVWFDRSQQLWTSYLIDDDMNQRSAAQYYASKEQFRECEKLGHFENDAADLAEAIDLDEWY